MTNSLVELEILRDGNERTRSKLTGMKVGRIQSLISAISPPES